MEQNLFRNHDVADHERLGEVGSVGFHCIIELLYAVIGNIHMDLVYAS